MSYKLKDTELTVWINDIPSYTYGSIENAMFTDSREASEWIQNGYSIIKIQIPASKLIRIMFL